MVENTPQGLWMESDASFLYRLPPQLCMGFTGSGRRLRAPASGLGLGHRLHCLEGDLVRDIGLPLPPGAGGTGIAISCGGPDSPETVLLHKLRYRTLPKLGRLPAAFQSTPAPWIEEHRPPRPPPIDPPSPLMNEGVVVAA